MKRLKPLTYTLALSFLFHLLILFGIQIELPKSFAVPEMTVTLQTPPPPPIAQPTPAPPKAVPKPVAAPRVVQAPNSPALQLPPPLTVPVAPPEPAPLVKEPPGTPAEPSPAPAPITPPFPSQMELVFEVHRGEQGLVLGRTTHKWITGNNQYLLTSSTEATGLFALFFGGRYLITSRGAITEHGLKPTAFWIQRGQDGARTEYADFDWPSGQLNYGKFGEQRTAAITEGTQDSLSVFYHLALTAPRQGRFKLALTTGRKFKQYDYQVIGEENVETPLGTFRTQRLGKVVQDKEGGTADIWLAIDRLYLPVRFRLETSKGEIFDHLLIEHHVP